MAETALTPYYAARATQLAAGITEQAGEAQIPLDPAEFERRYGRYDSYTEKSFELLTAALTDVEKGVDAESAADYAAAHKAAMTRVLVGTARTGVEARYVDLRPEGERHVGLVVKSMAAAPAPRTPVDLATIETEAQLLAAVGPENMFSDESFRFGRYQAVQKGMNMAAVDAFITQAQGRLTSTMVTDRAGQPVQRWVPSTLVAPAAAAQEAEATE